MAFGDNEVVGQTIRVEVMKALGFRETVAFTEAVQADGALAGRQVTRRQIFPNQLEN